MLVTLEDVKNNLGITNTDYDAFLTEQIELYSEAVELYCGRKFLLNTYTQEFLREDFNQDVVREIYLYHYPVKSISSIVDEDNEVLDEYRLIKETGLLRKRKSFFNGFFGYNNCPEQSITVRYQAGYETLPATIRSVMYTLVGAAYNKKQAGVDLNFGVDVQRISLPGVMSIDYDYTLQNNDQSTVLGTLIGNQANILDQFRSERKVIGTLKEGYVY